MMTDDEIEEYLKDRQHDRDRESFRKAMLAEAREILAHLEPEYRETA